MEDRVAKRMREMPPSSEDKVCIICTCYPVDEDDQFRFYIVDLNSKSESESKSSIPYRSPTLRIGCAYSLHTWASCVLGSTLYVFGDKTEFLGGKNVFKYVLRSDDSNVRLDSQRLEPICDMLGEKNVPMAMPTPDGKKIIVFSQKFMKPDPFDDFDVDPDFELYDPVHNTWEQLPGFPSTWTDYDFNIDAYTFKENKNVLMLRADIVVFTLDFTTTGNRQWERSLQTRPGEYRDVSFDSCFRYFILIGDLHLTPMGAYDWNKKNVLFEYPELSVPPSEHSVRSGAMTLLDLDESQCRFCIALSDMNKHTLCPVDTVQVYKLDLVEYRNYQDEDQGYDGPVISRLLPGMTHLKSFQFVGDKESDEVYFVTPLGTYLLLALRDIQVSTNMSLLTALSLMNRHGLSQLPVIILEEDAEHRGRPVGLLDRESINLAFRAFAIRDGLSCWYLMEEKFKI